jgi:hypothetical protein
MNTVLVEFKDGYRVTTSGWYLRKAAFAAEEKP